MLRHGHHRRCGLPPVRVQAPLLLQLLLRTAATLAAAPEFSLGASSIAAAIAAAPATTVSPPHGTSSLADLPTAVAPSHASHSKPTIPEGTTSPATPLPPSDAASFTLPPATSTHAILSAAGGAAAPAPAASALASAATWTQTTTAPTAAALPARPRLHPRLRRTHGHRRGACRALWRDGDTQHGCGTDSDVLLPPHNITVSRDKCSHNVLARHEFTWVYCGRAVRRQDPASVWLSHRRCDDHSPLGLRPQFLPQPRVRRSGVQRERSVSRALLGAVRRLSEMPVELVCVCFCLCMCVDSREGREEED